MEQSETLLILNPVAGRKGAQKALYPIVRALCAQGSAVTVFTTSTRGQAARIAQAEGAKYSRIICLGGDGTLNEVLSGIVRSGARVPVGYIPTGTTNDLAHALHLPTELERSIEVLKQGDTRAHDVGVINKDTYFDYVASFGAFADTAYSTPQKLKNALGRGAYFLCGVRQAFSLKPHHLVLTADDVVIEGDFYYGSISNSTRIAGIIDLNGKGVAFDDGLFEVLLIRQPPSVRALHEFRQHKYDPNYFYFFSAQQVHFEFSQPADWSVDGECAGAYTHADVQCLKKAVDIIAL